MSSVLVSNNSTRFLRCTLQWSMRTVHDQMQYAYNTRIHGIACSDYRSNSTPSNSEFNSTTIINIPQLNSTFNHQNSQIKKNTLTI